LRESASVRKGKGKKGRLDKKTNLALLVRGEKNPEGRGRQNRRKRQRGRNEVKKSKRNGSPYGKKSS